MELFKQRSAFFRNRQVIETFRGRGIWQPAVDLVLEKVDGGGWVRVLPFGFGDPTFWKKYWGWLDRSACSVKARYAKLRCTTRRTALPSQGTSSEEYAAFPHPDLPLWAENLYALSISDFRDISNNLEKLDVVCLNNLLASSPFP